MKFITAYNLIKKARIEKEKSKLWEIWLINFASMTKDTYESFDDFYKGITNPYICTKTDADIIAEVEEIRKKVRERDGNI